VMVSVRVILARVVLFAFEGCDIAAEWKGESCAVSCFSRSRPVISGRDGDGEEDEEEFAVRVAI